MGAPAPPPVPPPPPLQPVTSAATLPLPLPPPPPPPAPPPTVDDLRRKQLEAIGRNQQALLTLQSQAASVMAALASAGNVQSGAVGVAPMMSGMIPPPMAKAEIPGVAQKASSVGVIPSWTPGALPPPPPLVPGAPPPAAQPQVAKPVVAPPLPAPPPGPPPAASLPPAAKPKPKQPAGPPPFESSVYLNAQGEKRMHPRPKTPGQTPGRAPPPEVEGQIFATIGDDGKPITPPEYLRFEAKAQGSMPGSSAGPDADEPRAKKARRMPPPPKPEAELTNLSLEGLNLPEECLQYATPSALKARGGWKDRAHIFT